MRSKYFILYTALMVTSFFIISQGKTELILVGIFVLLLTSSYFFIIHKCIRSRIMRAINYIICLPLPILSVQFFSLGQNFYSYSGWNAVKDFNFDILEYLIILLPLYLSLGILSFFTEIFYFITKSIKFRKYIRLRKFKTVNTVMTPTVKYICSSILIVLTTLPVYFWMSKNGIGITGLVGPSLPFKLSGILYYATRYAVPILILLICFYYNNHIDSRVFIVFVLSLIAYAVIIASLQSSRFTLALIVLPLLFLLYRQSKLASFIGLIGLCTGIVLVTLMRSVRLQRGQDNMVVLSQKSLFESFSSLVNYYTYAVENFDFKISNLLLQILGRLESPQSIVLASQFDPVSIGGPFAWLLKLVQYASVNFDADLYHNAWIGTTLPIGYVSAPGFVSKALILYYNDIIFWLIWLLWLSFWIVILDKCWKRLSEQYEVIWSAQFVISLLVAFVFCSAPGSMRWYLLCIGSVSLTYLRVRR